MGAGITAEVVKALTAKLQSTVAPDMAALLAKNLGGALIGNIARKVVRASHATLTRTLTEGISRALLEELSVSLSKRMTMKATSTLLPTLVLSLNMIVSQSLMHEPKADYYCHYCETVGLYCRLCSAERMRVNEQAYYADYFSSYFAAYYTWYYAGSMANAAVQEYFDTTNRGQTFRAEDLQPTRDIGRSDYRPKSS